MPWRLLIYIWLIYIKWMGWVLDVPISCKVKHRIFGLLNTFFVTISIVTTESTQLLKRFRFLQKKHFCANCNYLYYRKAYWLSFRIGCYRSLAYLEIKHATSNDTTGSCLIYCLVPIKQSSSRGLNEAS